MSKPNINEPLSAKRLREITLDGAVDHGDNQRMARELLDLREQLVRLKFLERSKDALMELWLAAFVVINKTRGFLDARSEGEARRESEKESAALDELLAELEVFEATQLRASMRIGREMLESGTNVLQPMAKPEKP